MRLVAPADELRVLTSLLTGQVSAMGCTLPPPVLPVLSGKDRWGYVGSPIRLRVGLDRGQCSILGSIPSGTSNRSGEVLR